ncbi:UNVERIFIED_CONTAM: hypothetical protein Slati_2901100 [Sesamum latifolium]|uniref:Uncharacterized protein n=1 Tax=Sesamum latifolium TaxID=2727402 RepID=A0AAW2VDT4_9LAMI
MSSATPPIPCGHGHGRCRGPPLPTAPSNTSQIGAVVCFPSSPPPTTPPSAAPQTPDDAGLSRGAPTSEEVEQQSIVAAAAPAPPPPAVPPPSARQYINLADARSDCRFHEHINAVVQGHFPLPWSCLRQVPAEHQHF